MNQDSYKFDDIRLQVDKSVTNTEVKGVLRESGTLMWDHNIQFNDAAIECSLCGMSVEIPALMQQTTGFREAVYRMFILSSFKEDDCMNEYEPSNNVQTTKTGGTIDANSIYWSDSNGLDKDDFVKRITDNKR